MDKANTRLPNSPDEDEPLLAAVRTTRRRDGWAQTARHGDPTAGVIARQPETRVDEPACIFGLRSRLVGRGWLTTLPRSPSPSAGTEELLLGQFRGAGCQLSNNDVGYPDGPASTGAG